MEEEKLQRQEEIKNRVIAIYENIQKRSEVEENSNKLDRVIYYDTIRLASDEGEIEFYNVYVVRTINPQEKVLYEIYDENMLVATINENGEVEFTEEYKQELLDNKNKLFADRISKMERAGAKLEAPEELKEEDKEFVEQDILQEKKKKEEASKSPKENIKEENIKELDEAEQEELIAEELGLNKNDLVCKAKINPKQILTDSEMEKETFEDIAGCQDKYEVIYAINANKQTEKNKRFAFVGITKEGSVEPIELPTRGTTVTDRAVYTINRDGSTVEEKQVTEMFNTKDKNKALSVTVGQYGRLEINYLRRSPEENKYIGSPVETEIQRPTWPQVRKFMNERNTSRQDLKDIIPDAKEQIAEQESEKTNLNNIDENPNNDKALDPNEEIKLHDETITTLRKEAENLNLTQEEYNNYFEKADGDCASDKVMNVRQEILEKEETHEPMGRDERLTPEEEALLRNNKF